jgi:hypothetical protein
MKQRFVLLLALPALLTLAVFALACGDDDDNNGTSGGSATQPAGGSRNIPERSITARDFSYDFPNTIEGGLVKLSMKNDGKEDHQAQVLRLNDGVTPQQFQAALQGPDEVAFLKLVTLVGGPNVVQPGKSQTVIDDFSRPGSYAFLCFVSGDDDIPHLAKGMVKTFEVTAPQAAQPAPPEADARVTLADYSFLGLENLSSKKTTVEVTNGGPQSHELTILRLQSGFTVDQLKTALLSDEPPPGPPPFESAGGLGALASGSKGWAELDLTAGNYALICFVPDAATGAPHAALGMIKALTVK